MNMVKMRIEGTGEAINVELGYTPVSVELFNTVNFTEVIYDSIDTDNPNGVAVDATGAVTKAASAAAGVSVLEGDITTAKGIIIGASAPVNIDGNGIIVTVPINIDRS